MIDFHFTNLLKNANLGLKVVQLGEGDNYSAVFQKKMTLINHTGFGLDRPCQNLGRTYLGKIFSNL